MPISWELYPIFTAVFLAICSYEGGLPDKLTSPAKIITALSDLPLTIVSTATLDFGSIRKHASTIASDIASQTLSGWPAETDSEVNSVAIIDDAEVSPS